MSRNQRKDPSGGYHHITNHAVASEDLFLNDRDRYEFIRRFEQASERFNVAIVAYVLMGNHFHLIVWCPERGVSRFMHFLESVYAREFNMRHARRGPLFAGEFHNELIRTDGQAMAATRYVHRNPLELGIDIRTYPWSSYATYTQGSAAEPGNIDCTLALNLLGGPESYREYVETDFDSDKLRMSMGVRQVYRSAPDHVEQATVLLCTIASRMWAMPVAEIVAPRAGVRNDARLAVSLVAYDSNVGFTEEIRSLLGYRSATSLRTAVTRARRRFDTDPTFRHLVTNLRTSWAASNNIAG